MKKLLLFLMIPISVMASDKTCVKCHDIPDHYVDNHCTDCHAGIEGTSRRDLAHYKIIRGVYSYHLWESPHVLKGERMVKKYSCRRCHRINKEGSFLASNLDISVRRLMPEEVAEAIKVPNNQMPDFRLSQTDIEYLVNALLHYSRITPAASRVEVVHFDGGRDTELFQTKCGGCHMMLSSRGALGRRPLAPFISGIGAKYYPLLDNRTWSREMLSDWIDNPRKIKPFTDMPVTPLNADEKEALMNIIWGE